VIPFFLDSSGLIKHYVDESGSSWLRSMITGKEDAVILIARVTEVEVTSTFARRFREGSISTEQRKEAENVFCDDCLNISYYRPQ
jgi:hypothetical protein